MKTVFSNSQLAHVWAQQMQGIGQNSGNTMYFRDASIYSYGSHYLAARIYNGNTVLINEYRYSMSTGKHLSHIWDATSHYRQFSVSCPDNPLQSIIDSMNNIIDNFMSVYNKHTVNNYSLEYAIEEIEKHNKLCETFDQPSYVLPLDFFKTELTELILYKTWKDEQNNTPEMLEKKRLKAEKAALAKQYKLKLQLQDDLIVFKRSAVVKSSLAKLHPSLIAVSLLDKEVVTTRGARVPLKEAILGVKALQAGKSIVGMRLGSFTVNKIEGDLITIGCHTLSIKQATETLKGLV
jgi:hypothetical protein